MEFFWLIFKSRRWLDLQQCLWPLAIYLRPLKPRWVPFHCSSWLWSTLWMTITSSSSESWKTESNGKVVIIKIDVEGHECKALAKEVISKSPIFGILTKLLIININNSFGRWSPIALSYYLVIAISTSRIGLGSVLGQICPLHFYGMGQSQA